MFEIENYYDFIKTDKGTEKKPNLHAIHFKRLASYNKSWTIQKIIIFELMLFCHKRFGKNFSNNKSHIIKQTFLSVNTVFKYIRILEKEGYIIVKRFSDSNPDFRNRYTINFDQIINSLESIYNFEGLDAGEMENHKDKLTEWYRFLEHNSYNY